MKIKTAACVLFLLVGATGCSTESDTSSHDPTATDAREPIPQTGGWAPVAGTDWRAVIDDWYDNGIFDEPHSCAAIRVAIERLPRSSPDPHTAFEDLGRFEARRCKR